VSECTLEDIVLTTTRDDVDSLGIRKWSELKGYMKMEFITANNIPIAQSHSCVGDLGKNIANEVNCSGYKHQINASRSKKSPSPSTKPKYITNDGTLYRLCNVIVRCKDQFIELKNAHDKDDLDSRNRKPLAWSMMHTEYMSKDPSLMMLSPAAEA
jgi:hypothetical protein